MFQSNRSLNGGTVAQQTARDRRRLRIIRQLDSNLPVTDELLHARLRPRARRFWVTGTIALLILSYYLHTPLLVLCALLLLALGVVPEVWYLVVLRGTTLRRDFTPRQVTFGETATVTYAVENRKWLPVPWLEVEDDLSVEIEMPGVTLHPSYKGDRQLFITGMSLWANQRVTRRYQVVPLARGVWTFGPTYLRAGDPFGFMERERKVNPFDSRADLVVLPIVAPLTRFALPARNPFGDLTTQRRLIEDASQVIGARDYQPGDAMRRIHWKATARSTTLQSKVHPFTTTHTLSIFLDIHTLMNPTQGLNPDLFELAIAAAASVASWAAAGRYAVGLYTNGLPLTSFAGEIDSFQAAQRFMHLPPSTNPNQLVNILRALARLQPLFGPPIERVLAREQYRLPIGATIIFIGAAAALRPETVARLTTLQRRGYVVALLLTGSDEVATAPLRTHRIGGEETWHALINDARQRHESHRADQRGAGGDAARRSDAGDAVPGHGPLRPPAGSSDEHSFTVG